MHSNCVTLVVCEIVVGRHPLVACPTHARIRPILSPSRRGPSADRCRPEHLRVVAACSCAEAMWAPANRAAVHSNRWVGER